MSIGYVLSRLGKKMGLSPTVAGERATLLDYTNEAAREIYAQMDAVGSLLEAVFQVSGDKQLSLPSYVGPLRAMREADSQIVWTMNNMRPRYHKENWPNEWRKWRFKGYSPIVRNLEDSGIVSVESTPESEPVIVSVRGTTANATSAIDRITANAASVDGVLSFSSIKSIKKDRVNLTDITVKDINGTTLAVIPNDALESRYSVVDVSLYPFTDAPTSGQQYMEVLYKERLPEFTDDDEDFPAPDCEDALVNKAMQLWAEEQEKGDAALSWDAKATRTLGRSQMDKEQGQEQVVEFSHNKHVNLFRRPFKIYRNV